MTSPNLPSKVRISVGSAMVLELINGKLDAPPTTVYLLTYQKGKCSANCGFCPQSSTSTSRADLLSRVVWPAFSTHEVVSRIALSWQRKAIQRVCVQALNYEDVFSDLLALTTEILSYASVPVSVSCQPLNKAQMEALSKAGVNRVGVALDAATEELFSKVKGALTCGPYTWKEHKRTLEEAVQVFGRGLVSTHLIVGLGETERELVEAVQWCVDLGVYPSLFAFTPISGTAMEKSPQPSLTSYRRVQLACYLIIHGKTRCENIKYDGEGRIIGFGVPKNLLKTVAETGQPFYTSGCPGCNRPYYNERPTGPIYNYPRSLTSSELAEIKTLLEI